MGRRSIPTNDDLDYRELFAEEYCLDMNATAAIVRAGFTGLRPDKQGSKMLGDPVVKAKITEIMRERANDLYIDQRWVIDNLVRVYGKCADGFITGEGDNTYVKIDSSGANKALELIGKHLGMFSERLLLERVSEMKDDALVAAVEAIKAKRGAQE